MLKIYENGQRFLGMDITLPLTSYLLPLTSYLLPLTSYNVCNFDIIVSKYNNIPNAFAF
jgi:hypothetical protein